MTIEPCSTKKRATPSIGRLFTDNRLGAWRLFVQAAFFVFTIYLGYRFLLFFRWATGASEQFSPRPPGVEGFLPISALLSLKRLVLTGQYDSIHPAGLTIFLAALAMGLFLRKGFCGWLCPVGFASQLAERLGRRLKILVTLPAWLAYPLQALKYLLLAFFCYVILWQMNLAEIEAFQTMPYNLVADGKMLLFFLEPSRLAGGILIFLLLISLVIPNFWCRFLCPYGGLLGLTALLSPLRIRRQPATCINCQRCDRVCPGRIKVSQRQQVLSAECIGCLECVARCPVENCLTLTAPGAKKLPAVLLPLGVVGLFIAFYLVALLTGHWHSTVTPQTFKQNYAILRQLGHPPM